MRGTGLPAHKSDAAAAVFDQAAASDAVRATADAPWLAEVARAFGDLERKVATADVWKILKLSPYGRTMEQQPGLTAVMRLLGWDRRLLGAPWA